MTIPPGPRHTRSHRKKNSVLTLKNVTLVALATLGLALIVAVTVPAVLSAAGSRHGAKPAPTVTVERPLPQPTQTITAGRPRPTVTVTVLEPGPTLTARSTVTILCQHPGRQCRR